MAVQCWHTPSIPALGRQGQADNCALETNLVHRVPGQQKLHREPCLKQQTNKQKQQNEKESKAKLLLLDTSEIH